MRVRPGIVQRRLAIARLYGRSRDEIVRLANAGLPALYTIPALDAAPTILATCAGIPALEHHLLRLKLALEDARRQASGHQTSQIDMVLAHVTSALATPERE
jgi:hypothetical protein